MEMDSDEKVGHTCRTPDDLYLCMTQVLACFGSSRVGSGRVVSSESMSLRRITQ